MPSPSALADQTPAPPGEVHVSARDTLAVASWDAAGAAGFVVELAQNADFSLATATPVSQDLVVLGPLTPATTYYVRVSTRTTDGATSQPGTPVTFTTTEMGFAEPPPVLTVESDSSTSLTPAWSAAAAGLHYQVQLDTDDTFDNPNDVIVNEATTTFAKLTIDTAYTLRVRVVDASGAPQSAWSTKTAKKTAASQPLTVGSYNVLKAKNKSNWVKRRGAVAATILGENADVVGLQEATPVHVPGGYRQYADVARLLGSEWGLTTSAGEARIVYNKARLTLLRDGYQVLHGSNTLGVQRYAPWAVFEQKSTGKKFFFMNTHFLPQNGAKANRLRASAARQMVAAVKRDNTGNLPVVIVGDFNTGGMRNSANAIYRTFLGAGYIDPLTRTGKLGSAEKKVRTHLKTVNKLKRKAPVDLTPPLIDQIFVSKMRVASYEVVAKINGSGQFVGTIPSDHNMIRATVYLP
jgi:endonuclease/exonuclease/phosphatase family metal-dependent hydrolase